MNQLVTAKPSDLFKSSSQVVKKDTAKVEGSKQTLAENATQLLCDLENKRKVWEDTVYRTSNQALYAVLAECLAYGGDLPIEQAKQRSAALAKFCAERKYVVKKNSPLLTRVVKAVFGNVDRRRISTYSLVLRAAKAENVQPAALAQWIEENGGIQEIKLKQSATFVSPKTKAETAKQGFEKLPELAVVKTDALSQLADADYMGECCVLIAEQQADGSYIIRGLTRSGGAVNAALAAMYAAQKTAAA